MFKIQEKPVWGRNSPPRKLLRWDLKQDTDLRRRGEHSNHALNSIPMQRIKEGEADRYHNKVPDLGLYDIFFQHSNVARAPCIQPHSASNVEFWCSLEFAIPTLQHDPKCEPPTHHVLCYWAGLYGRLQYPVFNGFIGMWAHHKSALVYRNNS